MTDPLLGQEKDEKEKLFRLESGQRGDWKIRQLALKWERHWRKCFVENGKRGN